MSSKLNPFDFFMAPFNAESAPRTEILKKYKTNDQISSPELLVHIFSIAKHIASKSGNLRALKEIIITLINKLKDQEKSLIGASESITFLSRLNSSIKMYKDSTHIFENVISQYAPIVPYYGVLSKPYSTLEIPDKNIAHTEFIRCIQEAETNPTKWLLDKLEDHVFDIISVATSAVYNELIDPQSAEQPNFTNRLVSSNLFMKLHLTSHDNGGLNKFMGSIWLMVAYIYGLQLDTADLVKTIQKFDDFKYSVSDYHSLLSDMITLKEGQKELTNVTVAANESFLDSYKEGRANIGIINGFNFDLLCNFVYDPMNNLIPDKYVNQVATVIISRGVYDYGFLNNMILIYLESNCCAVPLLNKANNNTITFVKLYRNNKLETQSLDEFINNQ